MLTQCKRTFLTKSTKQHYVGVFMALTRCINLRFMYLLTY